MSQVDIDEIWTEFRKHVSDPAALVSMGRKLTDGRDKASLRYSGYAIARDMAEMDDEFCLASLGLIHGARRRSLEETTDILRFQMTENGLSPERAAQLLSLWRRETGTPGPEHRLANLWLHEGFLATALESVRNEITSVENAIKPARDFQP